MNKPNLLELEHVSPISQNPFSNRSLRSTSSQSNSTKEREQSPHIKNLTQRSNLNFYNEELQNQLNDTNFEEQKCAKKPEKPCLTVETKNKGDYNTSFITAFYNLIYSYFGKLKETNTDNQTLKNKQGSTDNYSLFNIQLIRYFTSDIAQSIFISIQTIIVIPITVFANEKVLLPYCNMCFTLKYWSANYRMSFFTPVDQTLSKRQRIINYTKQVLEYYAIVCCFILFQIFVLKVYFHDQNPLTLTIIYNIGYTAFKESTISLSFNLFCGRIKASKFFKISIIMADISRLQYTYKLLNLFKTKNHGYEVGLAAISWITFGQLFNGSIIRVMHDIKAHLFFGVKAYHDWFIQSMINIFVALFTVFFEKNFKSFGYIQKLMKYLFQHGHCVKLMGFYINLALYLNIQTIAKFLFGHHTCEIIEAFNINSPSGSSLLNRQLKLKKSKSVPIKLEKIASVTFDEEGNKFSTEISQSEVKKNI